MIVKSSLAKLFGASALTVWPFIFIVDPSDAPLIAHEMTHYDEQLKYLVVFWWVLYLLSRAFRQRAEVKAYKVQIALGGLTIDRASYYLSSMYFLGITQEKAKSLLM